MERWLRRAVSEINRRNAVAQARREKEQAASDRRQAAMLKSYDRLFRRKGNSYCGAKCRDGHECRRRPVAGRDRCPNHGGCSTGPRTDAGRAAIAASNRMRAAKTCENMQVF
jgi:hypothetical protein